MSGLSPESKTVRACAQLIVERGAVVSHPSKRGEGRANGGLVGAEAVHCSGKQQRRRGALGRRGLGSSKESRKRLLDTTADSMSQPHERRAPIPRT